MPTLHSERGELQANGTVSPIRICSPGQAEEALFSVFEYLTEGALLAGQHLHGPKVHLLSPAIRSLLLSPTVVQCASDLLQTDDLGLWSSGIFVNRPTAPVWTGWHQDGIGYPLIDADGQVVRVWIGLTVCTEANGTMEVALKSSKFGYLKHTLDDETLATEGICVTVDADSFTSRPVILNPGEAEFHSLTTVHRSRPNTSTETRVNLSADFITSKVRPMYDQGDDFTFVRGNRERFTHFRDDPDAGDLTSGESLAERFNSSDTRLKSLMRRTSDQMRLSLIERSRRH